MDPFNDLFFSYEECRCDKPTEKCYAPCYMLHFVGKGSGYFNGVRLTAGNGFLARRWEPVMYYPDKDDPWSYAWINFSSADMLRELEGLIDFDEHSVFSFNAAFPYYKMLRELHRINA